MKKITIFAIILLITISAFGQLRQKPMHGLQVNGAHSLSKGLVGCWLFNEGAGWKYNDSSGNGNHGTQTAAFFSWVGGKLGSAIRSPGSQNSRIVVPNTPELRGFSQVSVSVWVKVSVNTSGGIIGDWNADSCGWLLYYSASGTKIGFAIKNVAEDGVYSFTGAVSLNTWYHVVGTYDGVNVRIYLDSVLISTQPQTGLVNTALGPANDIWIGGYGSNELAGDIDNIMVYNRTLSALEVALDFREPFCMFEMADIALMEVAIPAPTVGGQVIIISKAAIPFILVLSVILIKRRKVA